MKSALDELSDDTRDRLNDEFRDSYMKPEFVRGDWLELICYDKIYYAPFSDYVTAAPPPWWKSLTGSRKPDHCNKVGARLANFSSRNGDYAAYWTDWKLYDTAEDAAEDLLAIYGRYL